MNWIKAHSNLPPRVLWVTIYLVLLLTVASTGFSAIVETKDNFQLPDGREIIVKRVFEDKFTVYTGDPTLWTDPSKIHFEFFIQGQPGIFLGTMLQGYKPGVEGFEESIGRLAEGVDYVKKARAATPDIRLHPTEFFRDLKFKGEKIHFVFSPQPMMTLNDFLFRLQLAEGKDVNWLGRMRLASELVSQLTPTLEALWQSGRVHFDLKPENIVISEDGRFFLIDFESISKVNDGRNSTVPFTERYAAPETIVLNGNGMVDGLADYKFHPSYDMYSFGLVLQAALYTIEGKLGLYWQHSLNKGLREQGANEDQKTGGKELLSFIDSLKTIDPLERVESLGGNSTRLPELPALKKVAPKNGPKEIKAWADSLGLSLCYRSDKYVDPGNEYSTK